MDPIIVTSVGRHWGPLCNRSGTGVSNNGGKNEKIPRKCGRSPNSVPSPPATAEAAHNHNLPRICPAATAPSSGEGCNVALLSAAPRRDASVYKTSSFLPNNLRSAKILRIFRVNTSFVSRVTLTPFIDDCTDAFCYSFLGGWTAGGFWT